MKPPVRPDNLQALRLLAIVAQMDTKAPRSYVDHLSWIIPAVIGLIGLALDHADLASALLSKIWNLLFVNIWYVWLAAAAYGLYQFIQLIHRLHNLTNNVLPTLMKAQADNLTETLKVVEREAASRVSIDDSLSSRINSLDTKLQDDTKRGLTELQTKLSEVIRKEAHARSEGINAFQRELDKQFERMNDIETHLPRLVIKDIKEIETKLTTQITALNKRVDNVASLVPINMDTRKGQGLINTASRVPTPDEVVAQPGLGLINSIPPTPTPAELLADAVKKYRDKS